MVCQKCLPRQREEYPGIMRNVVSHAKHQVELWAVISEQRIQAEPITNLYHGNRNNIVVRRYKPVHTSVPIDFRESLLQ